MKRYLDRDIEKMLKIAARQFPSVIVTGPRQSGKTTLLKHLFSKSHRYVSMDNPDLRLMARDEPALFFENYSPPRSLLMKFNMRRNFFLISRC